MQFHDESEGGTASVSFLNNDCHTPVSLQFPVLLGLCRLITLPNSAMQKSFKCIIKEETE